MPIRTSDIFKLAINLTSQINKLANGPIIISSVAAALGRNNARTVFEYPITEIRPISGETITVQMLVK